MKHFKIEEFRCKDGSVTPEEAVKNITSLVDNVLDPARERYGAGIHINSGYRSKAYNQKIKGARNSQHCCENGSAAADICAMNIDYGCMMDWKAGNLEIAKAIVAGGQWDQMILYVNKSGELLPQFVHVSWKRGGVNRREIRKKVYGGAPVYPLLTAEEMKQLKGV
jgi:hypothetical protein